MTDDEAPFIPPPPKLSLPLNPVVLTRRISVGKVLKELSAARVHIDSERDEWDEHYAIAEPDREGEYVAWSSIIKVLGLEGLVP